MTIRITPININATDCPLQVTCEESGNTSILSIESDLWIEVGMYMDRLQEIANMETIETDLGAV